MSRRGRRALVCWRGGRCSGGSGAATATTRFARVTTLLLLVSCTLLVLCAVMPLAVHASTQTSQTTSSSSSATGTTATSDTTGSNNSNGSSSSSDDDNTRALLAAGDLAMSSGRAHYSEALANYTAALVRNGRSVRGLYSRALLLSLLRRRAAALADVDALLDVAPQHAEALALRLSLCAQSGQLDRAARDAGTLAALYTRTHQPARARDMRATQQTLAQYAQQWHTLTDLLDGDDGDVLSHELVTDDDDDDDNDSVAGKARHTGSHTAAPSTPSPSRRQRARYAQCVSLLTSVIRDYAKDDVRLRLRRAACAVALGDYAAASHDVHAVLHTGKRREGGSSTRARHSSDGSKRSGGGGGGAKEDEAASVADNNGDDAAAHYLMAVALNARVLRGLGALAQAQQELRRCLSLDPEYAPCARLLRRVRLQQRTMTAVPEQLHTRQYRAALRDIAHALRDDPHAPYKEQLLQWRCEAYAHLHDGVRGLPACDAALRRLGADNPATVSIYLHKAELHLHHDGHTARNEGKHRADGHHHRDDDKDDDNTTDSDTDDVSEEDMNAAARELAHAQRVAPHDERVAEMQRRLDALRHRSAQQGKNYYKILGVRRSASAHDIRRAYRKLAKQYHPDQLRSKNMPRKERERQEALFRDINEAKEVLLDADKRARYDKGEDVTKPPPGHGQSQPFYGQPFTFQFNNFAGGPGGAGAFPRGFAFPHARPRGGGPQQQQQFFFFQHG